MGLFNKKQTTSEPQECQHKYQDFPWYLEWGDSTVDVIEPYVCIYCGNRINKTLAHYTGVFRPWEQAEALRKRFDNHVKYKEEVEDMINDMILVDPEYLKYYHLLHAQRDPSTSRPQPNKKTKLKI